jgi:hypothetical protein
LTLYDLYPFLLLLGVLGLAILWEVRHRVVVRIVTRRLATAGIGFLVVLMVISIPVRLVTPAVLLPSSRLLSWQLSSAFGPRLDSATAQTTTAVQIEVDHPGCTPSSGDPSWLAAPLVTYTPWSVTITMRMTDTFDATCFVRTDSSGRLPLVGSYLMGLIYPVQLSEPLGGRALYDGSSFLPAARPYR